MADHWVVMKVESMVDQTVELKVGPSDENLVDLKVYRTAAYWVLNSVEC